MLIDNELESADDAVAVVVDSADAATLDRIDWL